MGGEMDVGTPEENVSLREAVAELQSQLKQSETDKLQLQTSYEEALQALADSEAKRETADKELKLARDQMTSMWKELESLHRMMDGTHTLGNQAPSDMALVNEASLALHCTLCKEKIPAPSPLAFPSLPPSKEGSPPRPSRTSWLFRRRRQERVDDLESHSKVCSSSPSPAHPSHLTPPHPSTPPPKLMKKSTSTPLTSSPRKQMGLGSTPSRGSQSDELPGEFVVINVTRGAPGVADLAPFKIVMKTNMPHFPLPLCEVHRSQGDFQWLFDALSDACPERIVPPLKPPVSLDATMSEFQRFLSRIAAHHVLRRHHIFIQFLTGSAEELRSLKAKHRPRVLEEQLEFKPAVGRDTNSGPLVATKDYLMTLEQNILGLVHHLEQSSRRRATLERISHWFRAVSEAEQRQTYLKTATNDLARTCEAMECAQGDSEEALFIHNLQSIAEFVRSAGDLLSRVEEAVDRFLYWDEEVSIIEAVQSSPTIEMAPPLEEGRGTEDVVFDDSGVSDITSSSNNSAGHAPSERSSGHMTSSESACSMASADDLSTSEKWAQASKYCADAKDYLEMMCQELSAELADFDLHKEKELKQALLDYAAAQLERHEKCQGKWFAMRYILDSPISADQRAILFGNVSTTAAHEGSGSSSKPA